jgi:LPS export ABC transporter protein LptC
MRWQHWAKGVLALVALAVAVAVGMTLKRRTAPPPPPVVVRTDPKAIIETTGGKAVRITGAHEDIRVESERQLTYPDGSTKLSGVKISADNRGDGRHFVVIADEGQIGKNESAVALKGHIQLVEGDGFTAETGSATYDTHDAVVRAPGPVTFHHNRLSGSGIGMLYEKTSDVLTILEQSDMRIAPDTGGKGTAHVAAGTTVFARAARDIRFDGGVRVTHGGQTMSARTGLAHLSMDEKRIEQLDLHDSVHLDAATKTAGGLKSITGNEVTLNYAADGEALERVAVNGDAVIQLAGGTQATSRRITAKGVNARLGPDGQTPVELEAKQNVELTLPADEAQAARTVKSAELVASGDPKEPERGLTKATFTGNVEYREKSAKVDRTAHAARLDVGLKAGMSAFDQASFTGAASFADQRITGSAASVKYDVDKGALELSGTEARSPRPHVENDQIAVDAAAVNVTLAGPNLLAWGNVKSTLQPPKKPAPGSNADGTKLPSMLKQDQAVIITADSLGYDGTASRAMYDGTAQLWQGDTSIKGDSIGIDSKSGDLTADGSVLTTTSVEQADKDKKKERVRSTATADSFKYVDAQRQAAYRGGVHLTGGQGDLTAESIDLYLKPSGSELDRAEASDAANKLVLREQGRKTTGSKLTYTSADDRYQVAGTPVSITDQCGRVTKGRTLTFRKATDTIEVDGSQRVRTQTKNGEKCQVTTR